MNKDLVYYVALSQVPGIGAKRFKILLEHFQTAKAVWETSEADLRQILDPTVCQSFLDFRKHTSPETVLEEIGKKKISLVTLSDKHYPKLLKQVFDPPPVLYFKGSLEAAGEKLLAVVGTRKITAYGKQVTEMLIQELAPYHLTIVSGLARGVDSQAHKVALENGLKTIAVLGCGVDIIYPAHNKTLAQEILSCGGAIVSEYPPGIVPIPGHFPARNRIISGLSLGVLITEADEKSGSLITANYALEQNREVFAVPGPIYSKLSQGPSSLIKQGAKLVSSANDIVEELGIETKIRAKNFQKPIGETLEEKNIIDLLEFENKHIDQLTRESKLTSDKLNAVLLNLELSGKIKNLGAGNYSLIS